MGGNRAYRDSIFTSYFKDEGRLLEMYNAISGKNYGQDTEVRINTLENVLFRDRINDLSFLLGEKLIVLIEAQTSLNANMPLRLLLYIARLYEKMVENAAMYRRKLVKIPKPEFIVLYNGNEDCPDKATLRLSDAFEDADVPNLLELVVTVYNVNPGHSRRVPRAKALHSWQTSYQRFASRIGLGLSIPRF